MRVNVGCGPAPIEGWTNIDNSLSVRIAAIPILSWLCDKLGLLNDGQRHVIAAARSYGIRWSDASRRIPLSDNSAQVVYSSHMLEHLDRTEAHQFLREAYRVLLPGGIIRLALPDLRRLVEEYLASGDGDLFMERTLLTRPRIIRLRDKLKWLIVGDRQHMWMYDGKSMSRLLTQIGFFQPRVLEPGQTAISDPGALDLWERADESVYVEAVKPIPDARETPLR